MLFRSSSLSFCFLFLGLRSRASASISRCTDLTSSTACFMSSIRRRLMVSVNLISRMRWDSSTPARIAAHRPPRVFPLVPRCRPLRRGFALFFQLLGGLARLADRLDLFLHLSRALGDAFV